MKSKSFVVIFCFSLFCLGIVSAGSEVNLKAEDEDNIISDDFFNAKVIGIVAHHGNETLNTTKSFEKPKIIENEKTTKNKDFIDLYESGKKAYLANDFKTCIADLEKAIKSYNKYSSAILRCKIECKDEKEKNSASILADDMEQIRFYESLIKQTLCLMNCKNSSIPDMTSQLPKDVVEDFEWKVPYDFLQLCYYQSGDLRAAADAAFTYLVYNPDRDIMKDIVKWYGSKLDSPKAEFVNRQPFLHSNAFKSGVEHYNDHEWDKSVDSFEKAVADFYVAEEECRAECERPFDMGWFPDFVTAVANHYVFCLKCKQRCVQKLSNIDGTAVENIVPLMYNYLQFSYYKVGDIPKAVRCVETFLMFVPNDSTMIKNKVYYQTNEKAEDSWFEVLPEARRYFERDAAEKKLMEFILNEFSYYNSAQNSTGTASNVSQAEDPEVSKPKGEVSLLD